MKKFYYYKGDWKIGKTLIDTIEADTICQADDIFKQKYDIDVAKDRSISVTLEKLECQTF